MSWLPLARRSFLSQIGAGTPRSLAPLWSVAGPVAGSVRRKRSRRSRDATLRMIGSTSFRASIGSSSTPPQPNGFGSALLYANNFLTASQTGYGLKDSDSAVVIVVRHFATVFAYNDAIWTKYGVHDLTTDQLQRPADPAAGQDQCLQLGFACGGAAEPRQHARRRAQARSASGRVPDGHSAFFGWPRASDRRNRRRRVQRGRRQPGRQLPHGAGRNRGGQPRPGTRIYVRVGRIGLSQSQSPRR